MLSSAVDEMHVNVAMSHQMLVGWHCQMMEELHEYGMPCNFPNRLNQAK